MVSFNINVYIRYIKVYRSVPDDRGVAEVQKLQKFSRQLKTAQNDVLSIFGSFDNGVLIFNKKAGTAKSGN